jgi:hypothetical protein
MPRHSSLLEMVTEIASEAAQNPNVVSSIAFQEELLNRISRKMMALTRSAVPTDLMGQGLELSRIGGEQANAL